MYLCIHHLLKLGQIQFDAFHDPKERLGVSIGDLT